MNDINARIELRVTQSEKKEDSPARRELRLISIRIYQTKDIGLCAEDGAT